MHIRKEWKGSSTLPTLTTTTNPTSMTRKQFEQQFREQLVNEKSKKDKPLLRQLWNDTIDAMCKNQQLADRARNWSHPKLFR